jgi:Fe-S-cluster-containing hydrogenase component 2
MEKKLVLHPEKCINCRTCTIMCAMRHFNHFDPSLSAVTVFRFADENINVPVMCLQCDDPKCVKMCQTQALTRLPNGVVVLDRARCIGCKFCVQACPTGTMIHNSEYDVVLKCDLCDGATLCAAWCPAKAIEYTDAPVGIDHRFAAARGIKDAVLAKSDEQQTCGRGVVYS